MSEMRLFVASASPLGQIVWQKRLLGCGNLWRVGWGYKNSLIGVTSAGLREYFSSTAGRWEPTHDLCRD